MTVVDDTYTGHVEPQTASRRTLPGATIIKMSVGPMDNNVYLVTCSTTGQTLMIDAANDPALLVELVREHAPKLDLIVTSHQHFDHWQALEAVAAATGAPTAAHQLDAEPLPVTPDRFLAQGRHRRRRRPHPRRGPPSRPHAGLGGAGTAAGRRPTRHPTFHR